MKLLTLEDYQKVGEDAKPEDVLKVMEAVGGVALKLKLEETLPFEFNKKKDD